MGVIFIESGDMYFISIYSKNAFAVDSYLANIVDWLSG